MRRQAFSTLASRSRNPEAAWTAATVNGVCGACGIGASSGRGRGEQSLRPEQLPDLLVARLVEAVVPDADGAERVRRGGADDRVDVLGERAAGLARSHGHSDDD